MERRFEGSRVDQDDVSYTPRETLDGNCSAGPGVSSDSLVEDTRS